MRSARPNQVPVKIIQQKLCGLRILVVSHEIGVLKERSWRDLLLFKSLLELFEVAFPKQLCILWDLSTIGSLGWGEDWQEVLQRKPHLYYAIWNLRKVFALHKSSHLPIAKLSQCILCLIKGFTAKSFEKYFNHICSGCKCFFE